MNLTEQIRVFESFNSVRNNSKKQEKFQNMPNIKAISRLLNEAEKHNINFQRNEMRTKTPTNLTGKEDTLNEYIPNKKSNRRPRLEPINENKKDVNFSDYNNKRKRINRINFFGYDSINEETIPVIRKISPKQKEQKPTQKSVLENLIKKPTFKVNNDKKEIKLVKEVTQNNETKILNEMNVILTKNEEPEKVNESNITFSSSLSEDANYAMLKTYEDMLYFDLLSIYPETEHLVRTKTKDFIQIKRKLPNKLPAIRGSPEEIQNFSEVKSHKVKISKHLEKVNLIVEI